MATLANRLKELRKANNLTQAELGRILGVGKTTVSMYETGNSTPSDEIKLKISQYFNISIDFLIGTSDISCIDMPEMTLHQKLALKLVDELEKQGYTIEEKDLPNLLMAAKIALGKDNDG